VAGFVVIWAEPSVLVPENSFMYPKVRAKMKLFSQSNLNENASDKTTETFVCSCSLH
jgi:hypothetical protein